MVKLLKDTDQLRICNDDNVVNLPAVEEHVIEDNYTFPTSPESDPTEPAAETRFSLKTIFSKDSPTA